LGTELAILRTTAALCIGESARFDFLAFEVNADLIGRGGQIRNEFEGGFQKLFGLFKSSNAMAPPSRTFFLTKRIRSSI